MSDDTDKKLIVEKEKEKENETHPLDADNLNKDDNVSIEEEIKKHITEEFKKMVADWIDRDDEIKEINKELKDLKEEKKQLENSILDYMEQIQLGTLDIGNGKLRRSVSKTKSALKHEIIQNSLVKVFKDVQKAHHTTKFILDNRPITERVRLKRTYRRAKKK
jgi:predicted  nucleic acid-binding Zn-ribbon protein